MIQRRLISITVLAITTLFIVMLAPILVLIALLMSVLPQYRSLPHALAFALGFLCFENIGVLRLTWLWLRYRNHPSYMARNQAVQYWWARGLLNLGINIYGLNLEVTGKDAIEGPSAIVIARHTSIADTVLPMLFFAEHRGEGMRYLLKKELMIMPCLDIAGNRLPNLFVDRSGADTDRELELVRELTSQAGEHENLLVYPEGTRVTAGKRANLSNTKPELQAQLDRWPSLLPPRLGGVSAMLSVNTDKDVVFLAHTGFEGSASPQDLINGSWRHQRVHLHFWRIPHSEIPADYATFIFENWDQMQAKVTELERQDLEVLRADTTI